MKFIEIIKFKIIIMIYQLRIGFMNIYIESILLKKKKGLWSTWWQLSIICENGICVNPMKNLSIHDGLDKNSNSEHYNESYDLKKKLICEEILLSEIKNDNVEYDKQLDKYNFIMIKKTDPIFKIFNRLKWIIKFLPRIYSLKGISKTI